MQPRRPHRAARDPAGRARSSGTRSTSSTTPRATRSASARPADGRGSVRRHGARSQVPLRRAWRRARVRRTEFARAGPQGRGARLLDAVHARPLRRPRRSRRWSRSRSRPRPPTTLRVGMLVLGNDYKHPVGRRQGSGDARPAVRRPARARHRRGLDDRRLRAGRASATTGPACASTRLAEAIAVMKGAVGRRAVHFARRALHDHRLRRRCRSRCSSRTRRSSSAAAAARCCGSPGGRPTSSGINPNLRAGEIGADAARDTLGDSTRQKIGWVREGRGGAVRRPRAPDPLLRGRDHRRRARAGRGAGAGVRRRRRRGARRRAACWRAPSTRCATRSCARREEWGVSYVVFGDDSYEQFAPVVARLAGT